MEHFLNFFIPAAGLWASWFTATQITAKYDWRKKANDGSMEFYVYVATVLSAILFSGSIGLLASATAKMLQCS